MYVLVTSSSLGILLTCGRYTYYDRISSLRGEECGHKTSLSPPLFVMYLCTFLYYGHRFASFHDFAIEFWNCSTDMFHLS